MEITSKFIFLFILGLVLLVGGLYLLAFYSPNISNAHFISIPIPVGAYSNYSLDDQPYPYGAIDRDINEKLSLDDPLHYLAQLVWFEGSGFLEYELKNPLPKDTKVNALRMFFEACSEAKGYSLDQKTDISIYINGKKIGEYTVAGDYGGTRGEYTPQWWPTTKSQYGKPIFIEVRKDGTYIGDSYNPDLAKAEINLKKVSDVGIEELQLNGESITIKIGVDKDAQNKGGMNLFGEKFGNYPKTLTLGLEYEGEKIYQPTIAEVINNPEKYENKTVILAVHPGGWSCPPRKSTLIPEAEGFSRSSTMIYDATGCLYGSGRVLVGKDLVGDVHLIWEPGNETVVIKGKIKLDKNRVPFISPE